MMLSYYNGVKDNKGTTVSFEAVHKSLSSKFKDKVLALRSLGGEEFAKAKSQLPAVTFAGEFITRAVSGIKSYTGLAVLDFDKIECPDDVKEQIAADPHTLLAFISPSGNGVKVVIKLSGTADEYKARYEAALEYFKEFKPDQATSDISRLCFMSYDPLPYYNPNAEEFTKIIKRVEVQREQVVSEHGKVFQNLQKWQDKRGKSWNEGSRNEFICGLSAACCRFGIPEYEAYNLFMNDYKPDSEYTPAVMERYFATAYTKFRGDFGRCSFERQENIQVAVMADTRSKVGEEVFEEKAISHNILLEEVLNSVMEIYDNGHGQGRSTGITHLDEHFKLGKGRLTLFGGIPQHGKSQFTKVLMCLQALINGDVWAVYGPEDYPAEDFYLELAQIISGENVFKQYGKQIDRGDLSQVLQFVMKHFIYVYPQDAGPTPETIFAQFEKNIINLGVTGVLIDPFNQMENDIMRNGGREDLYISSFAQAYIRFGQKHNVYTWLVVHPNSDVRPVKGSKDPDCPSQFNLSGGQIWNAKCHDIIIVHRPYRESKPTDPTVWIDIKKIKKQRQYGVPGMVEFDYNPHSGRYEASGQSVHDWFPKKKQTV